jgi:hypothetical protein
MEWTKETLENTCILITSKCQGNKTLEFYKSFGFKHRNTEYPLEKGIYLYVKNGAIFPLFGIYKTAKINSNTIIKLPSIPRRKFPREMMVSDDNINWHKNEVVAKLNKQEYAYLTTGGLKKQTFIGWKYAKEI